MSIFSKISDFVGGSLFGEIKDGIMSYFPPDMTPQQKQEMELNVQRFLHDKEMQTNRMLSEASAQLDKRIAEQEGTASDLKAIPFLGPIIIFMRGLQRPVWGFAVLIMDYKWFFGTYNFSEQQEAAMMAINILVLGFLFGERTIKNLSPLIIKVFGGKSEEKSS